jgi:hypothetical protein
MKNANVFVDVDPYCVLRETMVAPIHDAINRAFVLSLGAPIQAKLVEYYTDCQRKFPDMGIAARSASSATWKLLLATALKTGRPLFGSARIG